MPVFPVYKVDALENVSLAVPPCEISPRYGTCLADVNVGSE